MCTTLSSYSVNELLFQVPLMDVEQYDVLGKASRFIKQNKTKKKNWQHFTGSITREDHMTSKHFRLYDFIFSCYKLSLWLLLFCCFYAFLAYSPLPLTFKGCRGKSWVTYLFNGHFIAFPFSFQCS